MRKGLAIILGIAAAVAIVWAVEALGEWLYPVTVHLDSDDPQAMAAIIDGMPVAAKLIVVVGWFLGTFGGAWLALRVSDWRAAGLAVLGVTLALATVSLFQFPHPSWMQAATVVAPLLGCWLAFRLHRAPSPGEPLLG